MAYWGPRLLRKPSLSSREIAALHHVSAPVGLFQARGTMDTMSIARRTSLHPTDKPLLEKAFIFHFSLHRATRRLVSKRLQHVLNVMQDDARGQSSTASRLFLHLVNGVIRFEITWRFPQYLQGAVSGSIIGLNSQIPKALQKPGFYFVVVTMITPQRPVHLQKRPVQISELYRQLGACEAEIHPHLVDPLRYVFLVVNN